MVEGWQKMTKVLPKQRGLYVISRFSSMYFRLRCVSWATTCATVDAELATWGQVCTLNHKRFLGYKQTWCINHVHSLTICSVMFCANPCKVNNMAPAYHSNVQDQGTMRIITYRLLDDNLKSRKQCFTARIISFSVYLPVQLLLDGGDHSLLE